MSIDKAKSAIARAEEQLADAKEQLKRAKKVELKPFTPTNHVTFYERRNGTPGFYDISEYKEPGYRQNPGSSKTKDQAVRRAQIDRVNDLLWGLKMTLEPDWVPDGYGYGLYYSESWWHSRLSSPTAPNTIYFSIGNVGKVIIYLNNHHPEGVI